MLSLFHAPDLETLGELACKLLAQPLREPLAPALVVVPSAALKERAYSAAMAATGLLYLAILTAFGTDLVARAVLG